MEYTLSVDNPLQALPPQYLTRSAKWDDLLRQVDAAQRDGKDALVCALIEKIFGFCDD